MNMMTRWALLASSILGAAEAPSPSSSVPPATTRRALLLFSTSPCTLAAAAAAAQPSSTPYSQSRTLQLGLDTNGKIRTCPSTNPGCVCTNPTVGASSSVASPLIIPDATSADAAAQSLRQAIIKTQKNVVFKVDQQTPHDTHASSQIALADEARRRAEEQRKFQLERRKQEDELKQVMQQEQHFERVKEQWKHSSNSAGKRKDRSKHEDEDGESGKRRRKGGKRRKDQKTKMQYEEEEEDQYRNEPEEDNYATMTGGDKSGKAPDHLLAAAGLEDSDAEDETGHPQSATERKRRSAWSESDDDEPVQRPAEPSPGANDPSE